MVRNWIVAMVSKVCETVSKFIQVHTLNGHLFSNESKAVKKPESQAASPCRDVLLGTDSNASGNVYIRSWTFPLNQLFLILRKVLEINAQKNIKTTLPTKKSFLFSF